jgi:serine/threonine protein kinase
VARVGPPGFWQGRTSPTTKRYTLLSEIGRGGAGTVSTARDEQTGSIVAIKLIREGFADDLLVISVP